MSLIKISNKKFHILRGLASFEKVAAYLEGFKASLEAISREDRFMRILRETVKTLEATLSALADDYEKAKEAWDYFQHIHRLLWADTSPKEEKIAQLDVIFDRIWSRSQELHPQLTKQARKSFLPASTTPYWKILAEWTRLWDSYKPGLFHYYHFPTPIKSNVEMEQKFSTETHRFRSQAGRAHVGHLIATGGEYALRFQYSSPGDYDFEAILANAKAHLGDLQAILRARIANYTKRWMISPEKSRAYITLIEKMYEWEETELTGGRQ